ncbi:aspartate kinase [Rufibacter glacialis]|uniref:Aspartokinase n=1 Tax=Rufibacter glacialis TaxID=1259555 RepID=A0A5M8QL27_9BACT|nr:aspartate kinase [Rufibacter glacialis]KAA6435690.1 aspartate kinase [Rufibacter glacialis]GGK65676.1 aspartokinase [Rufibacter glacialis]
MLVYKFGGASVKDAAAFRNIFRILSSLPAQEKPVVVVSAMGKTTNALEQVFKLAFQESDYTEAWQQMRQYHQTVVQELFPEFGHPVHQALEEQFRFLENTLKTIRPQVQYDEQYDQLISGGEILSSLILHHFLSSQGYQNQWLDCRPYLRTDATWREGRVDWEYTQQQMATHLPPLLENGALITQGFIGGTSTGRTTTLGREGSDFSAAIFAYCLKAESLTIWKDVPGLLNADPKLFRDTIRYEEIAYQEAIEMAYYGASVIHPKTVQPLAQQCIPLHVKSFLHPDQPGTVIWNCQHDRIAPSFILKQNQCLLSFHTKDFGFITEQHLSTIFQALSHHRLKINLMQNSAISFSTCVDADEARVEAVKEALAQEFLILYNQPLHLYTIKNYDQPSLEKLTHGREILLEQRSRQTFQFVCRPTQEFPH